MYKRRRFSLFEIKIFNRAGKRSIAGPVRRGFSNESGFTLVELLVVIAIIALLMAILMPALSQVKDQAKAAVCQMNLRQWGIVYSMYTSDWDGYFMQWVKPSGSPPPSGQSWVRQLRPYYIEGDIRVCPAAKKLSNPSLSTPMSMGPGDWPVGSKNISWGYIPPPPWYEHAFDAGDYGSYGQSSWTYNPPPEYNNIIGCPTKDMWRSIHVKGADNIPVFLDCVWTGGAPFDTDPPPKVDGLIWQGMTRYCIDRHNRAVNGLFLDWSVRRLGLKELYTLKWSRVFDINNEFTIAGNGGNEEVCAALWDGAAPWMKDMPEY